MPVELKSPFCCNKLVYLEPNGRGKPLQNTMLKEVLLRINVFLAVPNRSFKLKNIVMILVTGANGHLGSATIDYLLERNTDEDIVGLVRSKEKGKELKEKGVEIRIGDYNNYDTIEKALQGINTLLLISSSTVEGRVEQHKNVVDAAIREDIDQFFYTSIVQADKLLSPLSRSHYETEKLIQDSGIPYTIFRNTFYTDFLPMYWENALASGEWYYPSDGQQLNFALRDEMGEALANALADPADHQNETYEITSADSYTLSDIADVLQEETTKEITYHDISVEDFEEQLREAELPNDIINLSVSVAKTFVNGGLDFASDSLENLLGRKPTDTLEFVRQAANE